MNDAIKALRDALAVTPDNLPLRLHFARTLLSADEHQEAEQEFKRILTQAPDHNEAKFGLSMCYHQQGKSAMALVILEDLATAPDAAADVLLEYARQLDGVGQRDDARAAYRRALTADASVADPALGLKLGVTPDDDSDSVWTDSDEPQFQVDGRQRQSVDDAGPDKITEMERPDAYFDSVGGMEKVKDEIRLKIIMPLTNKELYAAYGKSIGGGILMYGPPGCGKTHLARATAGEVKAGFISVGLNDVLDMWIGNSEQKLHQIFEQARRNAPCVLFFDEVDALGASRTDMRQSAGRHLINQFLSELDGVEANNEGLLILAATNAPWHLDSAFRRPGRFDRIIFVPPPDEEARAEILELLLKDKPTDDINYKKIAKKLDAFSGADLRGLVDVTVEAKLMDAMKTGKPTPITGKDLLKAAGGVRPTTKEWAASARNYALYSNESGLYDDVLDYLNLKRR